MNDEKIKSELGSVYALALAALGGVDGGEKRSYRWGDGIIYDASSRTVSVEKSETIQDGDHRPVTSNAVQIEIGNIGVLLSNI